MEVGSGPQRPQFACIICRSRKVKCDKAPSGCARCRSVGIDCPGYGTPDIDGATEEIDNIYKRAGLQRRKAGACQECRLAKAKCSQSKPRCRRCQTKELSCTYATSRRDSRFPVMKVGFESTSPTGTASQVAGPESVSGSTAGSESVSHFQWLFESVLPDKSGLKILAESYFKHVHSLRNLGFIHKPAFMRAIDQETTVVEYGEAVVFLVCALGARYMPLLQAAGGSRSMTEVPGRLWGRRARKIVRANTCIPSAQNLMSMVLYAEYGLRTGDHAFVYMLVGCCTRMCRLLRLDVEDPRADSPATSSKQLTKRESRRRLMWSCYILDSFVGGGVDSNMSWITDMPRAPLASSDKDFLHQTQPAPVFAEIDKGINTWTPTDMRGNICRGLYCRNQILRHIRNYDAQVHGSEPLPWDPGSTFLRLLALTEEWYKQLPEFLAFSDINIYIHQEQHTLGAFFFIHLLYHACIFDIARVTLPGYNFPLVTALFQAPQEFIIKYRHEAWYHACCVSRLLATALECGTEGVDDHYIPTAAFESTKIQVIYLTTVANGDSRLYNEGLENINTNLKALTITHPYPDMPNVYLSALVPFLQRFGFSDIANQYQPFQNTVLYAPSSQATDTVNNSEVVGPVETAYLNQIATYRLARREVSEEERKTGTKTPWSLFPSAPPSPRPDRTRLPERPAEIQGSGLHMLALAGQTQGEAAVMVPELVQDPNGADAAPLDQEQYLRMAEEISEYMTWDVALPSQFDFPMEEYFSTPGRIDSIE